VQSLPSESTAREVSAARSGRAFRGLIPGVLYWLKFILGLSFRRTYTHKCDSHCVRHYFIRAGFRPNRLPDDLLCLAGCLIREAACLSAVLPIVSASFIAELTLSNVRNDRSFHMSSLTASVARELWGESAAR
jgi:hypothetical protein